MEALVKRFARENFGRAELGDRRLTNRLTRAGLRMLEHPGGTLPAKMQTPADLKGLYRLLDHERVTHAAVLQTHRDLTLERMRQSRDVVLLIHDTTQLDYTGKKSLQGLGQLAAGAARGYLCHNTLAVKEDGTAIGLAGQILHLRPRVPKDEPARQRRQRRSRETRLWKAGSGAVGPPPPGCKWVDVCDRGGDLFEYLDHKHARGGGYVVRSRHDRVAWAANDPGRGVKLHDYARGLPTLETHEIDVSANRGREARKTRVAVAAGRVTLPAPRPKCGEHGDDPLEVWVVHVKEIDPPKGAKALEWVLLTNEPAESAQDALRVAGWYARRPVVEEYHKAQKTGCGIELPQLTDKSRLEPVIAMISVVAVFLLGLRDAARDPEKAGEPAEHFVPAPYVRVVNACRWQDAKRRTTLCEFLLAVARMGGHQNRKSDGPPGWLTLWRGWQQLMVMVAAVEAVERCGVS
jgi:transposase-like protein